MLKVLASLGALGRRKRTLLFVLVASVLGNVCAPARAQILNIEKRRLEQREDRALLGNVGVHFNYNNRSPTLRRPARVMDTGVSSNLGYFAAEHGYMLISQYQMFLINESEIVNTGYSHARAQLFRERVLSLEIFAQHQYDRPRGLRSRVLSGAGPRVLLHRSAELTLTLGTGLMYELERWQHPELPLEYHPKLLKSSTYLSHRWAAGELLDLNAVVYFQTGYDPAPGIFRHRVSGEVNLAVKIAAFLSLTTAFTAAYENRPVVPIIPFVFAVQNGVRADF